MSALRNKIGMGHKRVESRRRRRSGLEWKEENGWRRGGGREGNTWNKEALGAVWLRSHGESVAYV